MKNSGHGHVYPRSDGIRARCGGPGICPDCARDQIEKDRQEKKPETFVPLGIQLAEFHRLSKERKV